MQSCVDSIPLPAQKIDAMLVFESEINPSVGFKAMISTSADLTDVSVISHPENLLVEIRYGTAEEGFELVYDEGCECYKDDEKPVAGIGYRLSASSPSDLRYEEITSSMVFPNTESPIDLEAHRKIESDGTTSVDASITISGESNSSNYFHIIPYRKNTEIKIVGQEEVEVYVGGIEYLDLVDFNSDNININIESHFSKPGFLVGFFEDDDISSNPLNLELYAPQVIDYDQEAFSKVFYEIRTVTESYYEYEVYMSRKLNSLQNGEVSPAISNGNITNGLGYFGGYNSLVDSIVIQ